MTTIRYEKENETVERKEGRLISAFSFTCKQNKTGTLIDNFIHSGLDSALFVADRLACKPFECVEIKTFYVFY